MPKISLKPGSAYFAEDSDRPDNAASAMRCEVYGCPAEAVHKAPKDRALGEYYNFCFTHVCEYNKKWNFFDGMSDIEVEEHTTKSRYGDRPTWRTDSSRAEESLKNKAWQTWQGDDHDENHKEEHTGQRDRNAHPRNPNHPAQHTPEFKALALMGLEPPLTLPDIKTRYKKLAMKHHPDLNKGCPKSEELLKEINIAYSTLKLAYQNFGKLPDRN